MLLQGLKVVELATWIAAPGCAAVMADWGADVIKVESLGGDATRTFFPESAETPGNPIFTMENRGKRGVALDIASPEGREALLAILKDADVFITNLRPGALKRARLDYDALRAAFPRLIYASVSGVGLEGPDVDLPAFDITVFWTKSGVGRSHIPPDQEPFACRPGFGDHTTALATLSSVLAALHERHATGRGRLVECSLLRTAAYALGWDMATRLRFGEAPTTQPRHMRPHPISGIYFRTLDDRWITFVLKGPACYPTLMKVLGHPEVIDDPLYALPTTDLDIVREIRARVDAAFARMTLAEAAVILTEADLAWAPLQSLSEVVGSPQYLATGCAVEVSDGWGGRMASPAAPGRFPEGAPEVTRGAPKLGEHTREVLAEAGVAEDVIQKVMARLG
ncbi:CaiB/BaiF CoA-transferase family protein [Phenylobacterium sp.]|uniref:CaiB/BaiF CoA transferase family protein n=3 Tax=Phenylobacterium sp. TaxID=1871053 RepID=UPI0025DC4C7A|nr:CaiB/BaiF CoA-transferase family protein [Phenylobacterium sp.]